MTDVSNNNIQSQIIQHQNVLKLMISNDLWDEMMDYMIKIQNTITSETENFGEFALINVPLINGNNPYHLACIRGKTDIIKKMMKLSKTLHLSINKLNSEGLPGIHLYYRYGGRDPFFLESKDICYVDEFHYTLVKYLIDEIDLLELLIDNMKNLNCLNNTGIKNDDHIYLLLLHKIHFMGDETNIMRYQKILETIYDELKPKNIAYLLILTNCVFSLECFFKRNINVLLFTDIYNESDMTPLALCVYSGYMEMLVKILEYIKIKLGDKGVFDAINRSDINYDHMPIGISIKNRNWGILLVLIDYMNPHVDKYEQQNKISYQFDQIDSAHNTYLHLLLSHKNIQDVPDSVIRYFMIRTDLNRENYTGITSSHLIFGRGIWMKYKTELSGKTIDLLKKDDAGNNCYTYVTNDTKLEFLEFSKSLKIPISFGNQKKYFDARLVKNILQLSSDRSTYDDENLSTTETETKTKTNDETNKYLTKNKNHNYGLFNTNTIHYMLYLRYLENKHRQLYIPVQLYDKKKIKTDMFFDNAISSYVTSSEHEKMVKYIKIYRHMYYSYLPHVICWVDEDCHCIQPNLSIILKQHDKTVDIAEQRYIMLKISTVVDMNVMHANVLVYDRKKKEAWRFEPYGTSRVTHKKPVDSIIKNMLQEVYGIITYYDPDMFLGDINFQMVDKEDDVSSKNLGDPGGYCLAWCLWFVDIILTHQDIDIRKLMKEFFTRDFVSNIVSEEEGHDLRSSNYYLDFIRRYARKLDEEKNLILDELGIKRYHMYNTVLNSKTRKIILNIFKHSEK